MDRTGPLYFSSPIFSVDVCPIKRYLVYCVSSEPHNAEFPPVRITILVPEAPKSQPWNTSMILASQNRGALMSSFGWGVISFPTSSVAALASGCCSEFCSSVDPLTHRQASPPEIASANTIDRNSVAVCIMNLFVCTQRAATKCEAQVSVYIQSHQVVTLAQYSASHFLYWSSLDGSQPSDTDNSHVSPNISRALGGFTGQYCKF